MPCKSDTTCFRLPENVAPKHYDLEIKPDISNSSFCGSVKILINIKSETDKIYFHTSDLKIENAHIIKNSIKIAPLSVEFQPKQNSCCLLFESKLDAQTVQLNISFSGKLEENMKGFYLTKYYDDYKHLHNCLATHFEPNDACRAFPCFDEPSFKATFKLTVIFEANKTVLSNTPLQSIMPVGDGLTAYTFDVTPIMSTYLVAYVMGDFDCLTTYTKSGIKFGVYMPIHKVHTGIHALKIGQNFLEFYNNYFKIPYPLKKMDVIALPDISIGAMENWGLVTFREDLLLVDPEKSSKSTIKFVNLVMAHEFAHQWFGNLVTMKWWTDLWLNEGFANWIEYLSVDQCCPHLNIWKSFTSSNYCRALELDSLSHSHPIEVEIHDPSELDEIFDDITYCKGASIIHMMVNYIGQPDFLAGLQQYFHQHMYSNVTTADLWTALSTSSGKRVDWLMSSFTEQVGYPLVTISNIDPCSNCTITLSQQRFRLNPKYIDANQSLTPQRWLLPIKIVAKSQSGLHETSILLEKEQDSFEITTGKEVKYILINPSRHGFFRALYPQKWLEQLTENLSELNIQDVLGLLSDYFSFARCGLVSTVDYLNLLLKYKQSGGNDEEVWGYIISTLLKLLSLIHYSKHSQTDVILFKKLCTNLTKPLLEKCGLTPTATSKRTDETVKLMSAFMSILCTTDDEGTGSILRSWLFDYIDGKLAIEPDFRRYMFKASFSSPKLYDKLISQLVNAKMTEEKLEIITGVSGITDPALIQKIYEFSINENIKPQDGRFIFSILGGSPCARDIGWNFIKTNFARINKHFAVKFIIMNILKETISGFCDLSYVNDVLKFVETTPELSLDRPIQYAIESIQINFHWLSRDQDTISKWLKNHVC